MALFNLPDDDQMSASSPIDALLYRQLDEAIARNFYDACDGMTQLILSSCDWQIVREGQTLSLVVHCTNDMDYWHFMGSLPQIERYIQQLTHHFKVRIFSPIGQTTPFEFEMADFGD